MNTNRFAVVGLGFLACLMAAGAEQTGSIIPAEDFARSADINGAKLAPDGKFMGYLFTHEGRTEVSFLDLTTGKARYYNPGRSLVGSNLQMGEFEWVSNERVIIQTAVWGQWFAGMAAVNRDAHEWMGLTGAPRFDSIKASSDFLAGYQVIYASGQDARNVLMLVQNASQGEQVIYPDVLSMDTITGHYRHVLKNPGNIIAWQADWAGEVRFGLSWDGQHSHLTYRKTSTDPWQQVPDHGGSEIERSLVGLDQTGQILHLAQAGQKDRWALFPWTSRKTKWVQPSLIMRSTISFRLIIDRAMRGCPWWPSSMPRIRMHFSGYIM